LKGRIGKSRVQEVTLPLLPLVWLKNRQADPPQIYRGYPKKLRFLLKRYKVIAFSFQVDASPQKTPSENFTL
jgi:hypothetical protein